MTPVLRRIGDAAPLVAVRESLPWSLAGLLAGLVIFMAVTPGAAFLRRFTLAELPAFGVMAAALAVILAHRLARRLGLSAAIVTAGAAITFFLALPRPLDFGEPVAYLRIVAIAAACFVLHLSLGNALAGAMQPLGKLGDTYAALLLITIAETLLWLVGIHGPAALAAVITPIYVTLQMQNTQAYALHRPLPHIVVVSLFLFVFPGGAGATLPLAAMLATSKAERLRKIGRVSVFPALFNISEPLLFGLPIVFNPFLAIPFVLVPVTLATITYVAVSSGFVDAPWQYVPSALPSFFATYLATFDVRAVVLVAINICVAAALYFPFFRALERDALRAQHTGA